MPATIQLLGIFGFPISHTLSPYMHNAVCKKLNLPYFYAPFEISSEKLDKAIDSVRTLKISGINITIPHKEKVIQYLDEISSEAKLIGAVNTIKNDNGKLIGYNTDGKGFIAALKEDTGILPGKRSFLIFGAGGACRSIAIQLALDGAKKIIIANRTLDKAENIADNIRKNIPACDVQAILLNKIADIISDEYILINTTPLGMKESDSPIFDYSLLSKIKIVVDIIYNPPQTPLLKEAQKFDARTANGLNMLVFQGALAFEIWTGIKPPILVMREALIEKMFKL
ncbi:shikimate dehydrogenase [Candidatus Desantisbacteria bacterium]|nr:shikimate dehydrogenase [Candidatus Desantisbacteria bacterium]